MATEINRHVSILGQVRERSLVSGNNCGMQQFYDLWNAFDNIGSY